MPEPLWKLLLRAHRRGQTPSPRERQAAQVEARMEALARQLEGQVERLERDVRHRDSHANGPADA